MNSSLAQVGRVQKGSCGRRGLPSWFVADMYDDYKFLGSTYKVARKYGRTAQSVWELFHSHRLAMKPEPRAIARGRKRVTFDGRDYIWTTRHDGGHTHSFFRCSKRDQREQSLQRAMWVKLHGPIPPGWQVSFLNGKSDDVRPDNLFCGTPAEVTQFFAQGLRSDGKPLVRRLAPRKFSR